MPRARRGAVHLGGAARGRCAGTGLRRLRTRGGPPESARDATSAKHGRPAPRAAAAPQVAPVAVDGADSPHAGCADAGAASGAPAPPGEPRPPLSPVSQMFLGMGEQAPDIYAILRLRGYAPLEHIVPAMQQLVDAHERFRLRVARRGGAWCTEVRGPRLLGRRAAGAAARGRGSEQQRAHGFRAPSAEARASTHSFLQRPRPRPSPRAMQPRMHTFKRLKPTTRSHPATPAPAGAARV